jgi:predicted nucleotidyltransferase component of viral defense system
MIQERIESYNPKNSEDLKNALREIIQETALAGLYRSGFFNKAAFYGGTALRIFHGSQRFSEDMDFSLLTQNENFDLSPYLQSLVMECEALGLNVGVQRKDKTTKTAIHSALLKTKTDWSELTYEAPGSKLISAPLHLKIKIEVDTNPPLGFDTEEKLLLRPFSCYIKCFSLPDLFAGKMHALLFRKWKTRVKGRDWYDMEWYIKKGVPLHLAHFQQRAYQSGDLATPLTPETLMDMLGMKIDQVSIDKIKDDTIRFIADPLELDIWSARYFRDIIKVMKFL